jgi:hypothetical protein
MVERFPFELLATLRPIVGLDSASALRHYGRCHCRRHSFPHGLLVH